MFDHIAARMPDPPQSPRRETRCHRFLHSLRDAKLISPKKVTDLLSWKHSGFHIDNGGEKPVPAHDTAGRKRLAAPERSGDRAPGGWPREG
jgi:hypothetical protein